MDELSRTVEALLQEALRMSPPYDTTSKDYVRKALVALAQPQHRDAPEGAVSGEKEARKLLARKIWADLYVVFGSRRRHETVWAALAALSDEEKMAIDDDAEKILVEALNAALAQPLRDAPEGWRPIESAPKDGTFLLFYDPSRAEPFHGGQWIGDSPRLGSWWLADGRYKSAPTHWQPLPPPPPSPSEPKEDKSR